MKLDLKANKILGLPESGWEMQQIQAMASALKGKLFEIVIFQDLTSNIPMALEIREHTEKSEDKLIVKEEKKDIKPKGKTIQ